MVDSGNQRGSRRNGAGESQFPQPFDLARDIQRGPEEVVPHRKMCQEGVLGILPEGKEEDIWRAMASKQPSAPMQSLVSPLGRTANTAQEKAEMLAEISSPEDIRNDAPVDLPTDTSPMKAIWTSEDTARFLGTRSQRSAPARGSDNFSYRELRLWLLLDPDGLTNLVNRMVTEGLPKEMKMAKAVYIHKPGKTDWTSPRSYRAISLISTIGKMAEKAVVDYLSLMGEQRGWWHAGQCGSRAGRSTIDTLAFLKRQVANSRRIGRHTALLMTDVAAAFPSTTKDRVVSMLSRKGAHPTIVRWVNSWLTDRSIETWINNRPAGKREVNCGVPQGSLCSPVLFALTLAEALSKLPEGISYVDDCSWAFSFAGQSDFQQEARSRLDNIRDTLLEAGFQMDKEKAEVAWFFASERPRGPSIEVAAGLGRSRLTRKFDIKAKPVQWLGFFLDLPDELAGPRQTPTGSGTPPDEDDGQDHDGQRNQKEASSCLQGRLGGSYVHSRLRNRSHLGLGGSRARFGYWMDSTS
jgi:hypothetical protein